MMRAFCSEVLKFRRWSVLVGAAAMVVATTLLAFLTFHEITSGNNRAELTPLIQALPTPQGLIILVDQARALILVIALIMVTANLAAEWSQGTLRNLLVREPRRLRLLAGKMLALLLFVSLSAALTVVTSSAFIIVAAHAQGIDTSAWLSAAGLRTDLSFLGNLLLDLVGMSLLGLLVAVLTRSTAAAVGIALGYTLLEGLVGGVWPEGVEWLPFRLFQVLVGSTMPASIGPTPLQGYTAALLAALLWMVGFAVVSAVMFRHQDITA